MDAVQVRTGTTELSREIDQTARLAVGGQDVALRRMLAAGDALAVFLALAVALMLPVAHGNQFLWGLAAIPLMIVLFKVYGLYDRDVKRISHSTVDDLPWLFHAVVIGTLLLWLYSKASPLRPFDFGEVLGFGAGTLVLVTFVRYTVRAAAERLLGRERALLIGGGSVAQALVAKLRAHPEYRVNVIGAIVPDGPNGLDAKCGLPILGSVSELERVVAQNNVARVVFSSGGVDERGLEQLLRRCRSLALKVSVLPRLSDVLGPAVEIDDVEGIAVLGLNPPWLPRSSRAMKRGMDVLIAAPAMLLSTPFLIAIAVAIKLDSRGPVFFSQERVGKRGKRFRLFKFRTMVIDAEQRRMELLSKSTDPDWLKLDHDPRVTRLGRALRRTSFDELPQLWNVLCGEMSLVGPRPLIPAEDERVRGWARGRLELTPGITGYWQVLGRTRIPFEEMVKLDYLYVMNWSLWEDVRLILRTLPTVIGGRGAN